MLSLFLPVGKLAQRRLWLLLQAACGAIVTAFKPKSPATFPTPDLVIKGAFDNKCDVLCAVPSYIEVRVIVTGVVSASTSHV